MALWLVRGGKHGERESYAVDHDVAVVGWDEVPDLSRVSSQDQVLRILRANYSGAGANKLGNWSRQLWAFISKFKPGDLVALPLKSRPAIAIGEVTGPYEYHADWPSGAKHARPVKWLREIPRAAFDQDVLYSFGAFLTVCRIERNNAELPADLQAVLPLKRVWALALDEESQDA